jgi:hypothetical protein
MLATVTVSAGTQGRGGQQPARDTPSQQQRTAPGAPAPTGRISGRVLAADNARPVRGARVFVNAAEVPGGRGASTDENGNFDLTGLPSGRYTLTVSKSGFISLSYGQRRPLQAGTPLQLGDGQQLSGIEFRLPRGSVIAGHVYDDTGEPMAGAFVQVMRYQYAQGSRQLVPAGGGQSDDRGAYRVWGLNPGDYYVSAVARPFDGGGRGMPLGGPGGPDGPGGRGGAIFIAGDAGAQVFAARGVPPGMPQDSEPVGYAPTFYPGVSSIEEARPVRMGLSAETLDIDFGLLLVRTAKISGRLVNPAGAGISNGTVMLTPDTGSSGRAAMGRVFGARLAGDGSFSLANVPPGRYLLRARGQDGASPTFAVQPVTVTDGDVSDLTVVLAPSARISGAVAFQTTQSATVPDVDSVRITAPAIDYVTVGPNTVARVDREGRFTLGGVPAGAHWIRAQGLPRGWVLKSVVVDGREVIDLPVELRSGQELTDVSLTFTDRLAEINGAITSDEGLPLTEYTVLAFPTDAALWRPQARQIMTARPDQNGKYQMRGLPAGEYYLTAVDPSEQGEWFEPAYLEQQRAGAQRLRLGDGDVKTQDFRIRN